MLVQPVLKVFKAFKGLLGLLAQPDRLVLPFILGRVLLSPPDQLGIHLKTLLLAMLLAPPTFKR